MTSALCYLLPLIIVAVALDLFIVKGRQRLRELRQEEASQEEKISRRELWVRAFFQPTVIKGWGAGISPIIQKLIHEVLSAKWWLLVTGVVSISYSQYLMETRITQGDPFPAAEQWNAIHKLEIVNYENVLYAMPYFVCGAVLCGIFGIPISWKKSFENWSSRWVTHENGNWRSQSPKIIIGIVLFSFLLFRLSKHQYEQIFPFVWLIAIWLFTYSIWKLDNNARKTSPFDFQRGDFFWIILLLFFGFAVCAFALNDIPVYIIPDEGAFWETARALAQKEIHPAIFDSGVYTFPIASSIFQGWILRIFGINLWSWRFASVIPAVMTVIPLYLLAKLWFGRTTAITAGAMMLANPYFISFSRMGYNNSQALFPVTLCIFFFALAARKGSFFYLWLAGLTVGFSFYTYFATWLGLVTLCFGVLYLWVRKELTPKKTFIVLGTILIAWSVVFAPRIAYTASGPLNEGLVYKIIETNFINVFYARAYYADTALTRLTPLIQLGQDHAIFYEPVLYGELLYRGTVRTFLAMFNPYIVYEHFLNSGLSGVISPIFFLIGLAISLRSFKQLRFALPTIWFISGMFFLSIVGAFPPRHTHMVSIIPCLALIAGIGLNAVVKSLTETTSSKQTGARVFIQSTILTAVALASAYLGFQRYYVKMPVDYPALFEDTVSWLAWRTEKPVEIIYLSETQVPHRVEYLINAGMIPHTYRSMLISEFSSETDLAGNTPTMIFVDSPHEDKFPLQGLDLNGFGKAVSYKYKNEYITGYATTNTGIDLNPNVGVADGLNSLRDTPVRYVLLGLFILLVTTILLITQRIVGWPRKEFLLEIGKKRTETGQSIAGDSNDKSEFDFHLRIRIPPRKRD